MARTSSISCCRRISDSSDTDDTNEYMTVDNVGNVNDSISCEVSILYARLDRQDLRIQLLERDNLTLEEMCDGLGT